MPRGVDLVLIIASMFWAIGFALVVWFFGTPPYARWAKIASLIGCAAGLSWSVITFFQHPFSMQRYPFVLPVSVKQLLGGIFIGILISVALSRLYDRVATRESDSTR